MARWFLLLLVIVAPAHAGNPPASAVASAHPLATAAGIEILQQGGNAFDAAVAVSATLAVVEPYSSGLGGGGFWLLHVATENRDVMIDGRECAPGAAHRDMYLDAQGQPVPGLPTDGALAAAIPGEPAALVHIAERYGRLPLRASLAPAIRHARAGFAVTPHYQRMATFRRDVLRTSPAAARQFLLRGEVPPLGHRVRQSELAMTLNALAAAGTAGFYEGPRAVRMVEGVRAAGGNWTLADLRDYRVVERAPVRGNYRGFEIVSAAPPSSGGVALVSTLNMLSGYPLPELQPEPRAHLIIEALRRAYRDRAEYLGDPDFVEVPVRRLLEPALAERLRASITERATPSSTLGSYTPGEGGNHTSHFSIIDTAGNYVSATLSINLPFGAGLVPEGTGVLLNNEMDDFVAKPGVANAYGLVGAEANAIAPGKRPLSSMTPTFVRDADGVAILGTPGGSRIITMVLLGVLEASEGRPVTDWVKRPRFHHQYLPDKVFHEPGAFDESTAQGLVERGHQLQPVEPYGNMQAIHWDRVRNRVDAASDPRVEGAAQVEQRAASARR